MARKMLIKTFQAQRFMWDYINGNNYWRLWKHLGEVQESAELAVHDICNAKPEKGDGTYMDVIVPNPD